MRFKNTHWTALIMGIVITVSAAAAHNGRWNSTRDYEPIILKGEQFPELLNVPISEIFVYSYNATLNTWSQIPFQIDEKLADGHYAYSENDGDLDSTEDIVFMARDMGDEASSLVWIADQDSRQYGRFVIAITDTVQDDHRAWAYLYRSTTLTLDPSLHDYISYAPSSDPEDQGADVIHGASYSEGHTKGIPDYLAIPIAFGGSGVDILDRQKLHVDLMLHINFGGSEVVMPATIRENFLQEFPPTVNFKDGPVRLLREVTWTVAIQGIEAKEFSLPLEYYPYSMESGGLSFTVQEKDSVDYIKQSFDLNEHAVGMKFYNPYNTAGIVIDGSPAPDTSQFDDSLDLQGVNWFLSTGDQGTFAYLFKIDSLGESHSIYFKDDSTLSPEGQDTGDMRAFGESGILIQSAGTKIVGNLRFAYKSFFLPGNSDPTVGQALALNFESPLAVATGPAEYLAVDLVNFTFEVVNLSRVDLSWSTASELANAGFNIERKTGDAGEWETIGFVDGFGTTTSPHDYSFTDSTVAVGYYSYRLKQIGLSGNFAYSQILAVAVLPVGVSEQQSSAPTSFRLEQNYPNPFNPETVIRYQIPETGSAVLVDLRIYNLLGDEIARLVHANQSAGSYQVIWNGQDRRGRNVAAGTYLYRLTASGFEETRKMLILR